MDNVAPKKPDPWKQYRVKIKCPVLFPIFWVEWFCEWLLWWTSEIAVIRVLVAFGKLTILFAVINYFAGCRERTRIAEDQKRARYYQAWRVINSAHLKGGDGGRVMALEDLNRAGISLARVNLTDAVLYNLSIPDSELVESWFDASVLTNAVVTGANLYRAHFDQARLFDSDFSRSRFAESRFIYHGEARDCRFSGCDFRSAGVNGHFTFCDFTRANLTGARVESAIFESVNFAHASMEGINWEAATFRGCNVFGVTNAPEDFLKWAKTNLFSVNITNPAAWKDFHRTNTAVIRSL